MVEFEGNWSYDSIDTEYQKSFLSIIYNESKVSLIYCLQFKFHLHDQKLSHVKLFTVTGSFVRGKID